MFPGQKVVCINDDFSNLKDSDSLKNIELPKKDELYTIRDVTQLGITLEEIVNKEFILLAHNNLRSEPRFAPSRFAPLKNDFVKIKFSKAVEAAEVSAN